SKTSADPNPRLTLAPQPYIKGAIGQSIFPEGDDLHWLNDAPLPGVISTKPLNAVVVSHSILTFLDSEEPNPKRELIFELEDVDLAYEPGDAFYITPQNSVDDVNFVLDRLGCLDVADQEYEISVDGDEQSAEQLFPNYLPRKSSLRHLFTYVLDIRRAPTRSLLRFMADSATDDTDKRRLLELCSVQGVLEYHTYLRQAALSLVDVLLAFPSIAAPIERFIETLPRLLPRPYSIGQRV
ncbi:hypothetical protein PENTCL1PPCAC_15115, partial [Pristionchus entomophagus]